MDQERRYYVRGGRQEPPPQLSVDTPSVFTANDDAHYSTNLAMDSRPKGLLNVGNTCYANAVLQCLLSTALTQALLDPKASEIFRRYASNPNLLDNDDSKDETDEECDEEQSIRKRSKRQLRDKCRWLTRELKAITVEYHLPADQKKKTSSLPNFPSDWLTLLSIAHWSQRPVVDPGPITKHPDLLSPCLRPYQQEDAHEFLRALLSTLVMNGQNKQLSSLFDGLLESSVTCQMCQQPSLTRDRYMDLSLDIDRPHVQTLTEALSEFTAEEILQDDNSVFCSSCETKRAATKALRLATAPSILVCHLKRFALDEYGRLIRVNKHIYFPERLQIGSYMSRVNKSRPPPYDLVALLVHQGNTCDSGHYIAFCKHAGEWYSCNDSVIQRVDLQTVLSQQAYILMYEVADMRENHGYPSPHTRRRQHQRVDSDGLSLANMITSHLLCGMDEALLRDFCCYENACLIPRPRPARNNAHSRDDSTLDESTVETSGSPYSFRLRRSVSSGHISRSGTSRRSLLSAAMAAEAKQWSTERPRERAREGLLSRERPREGLPPRVRRPTTTRRAASLHVVP